MAGAPIAKRLFKILYLVPIAIVKSLLITIVFIYFLVVFDIYLNTEKLSRVNPVLDSYCEKITLNPKFTKGPVVFRIDRGTLFFRLTLFVSESSFYGYSPFFIFPHNRTVIFAEGVLKMDNLAVKSMVAHELGHIQGGLKHFGPAKDMEKYANNFATEILKTQP